jgi:hypothetical protein
MHPAVMALATVRLLGAHDSVAHDSVAQDSVAQDSVAERATARRSWWDPPEARIAVELAASRRELYGIAIEDYEIRGGALFTRQRGRFGFDLMGSFFGRMGETAAGRRTGGFGTGARALVRFSVLRAGLGHDLGVALAGRSTNGNVMAKPYLEGYALLGLEPIHTDRFAFWIDGRIHGTVYQDTTAGAFSLAAGGRF